MSDPIDDPRRLAIAAIVRIDDEGAYANVVLPKMLGDTTMETRYKGFATELVYGSTRMKRRLDHLVDRFLLGSVHGVPFLPKKLRRPQKQPRA